MFQGPGITTAESYRVDLGAGVVVAFVEERSPELPERVAYVTHVPSGSQLVLDIDGRVIDRHDGGDDGPGRLDAVLSDEAAMERIMKGLRSYEDPRLGDTEIFWVHAVRFGGIKYQGRGEPMTPGGERALAVEDLGPVLYRVAFRGDGYVGSDYHYQDGDATFLNPGTRLYEVEGYAPAFRLGTLLDGRMALFEADTNPLAKGGEDLLGIRGRVSAIDILSEEDGTTVLSTFDEEHDVERIVKTVLASPVDQLNRDHEGARYFLGFRLDDGTSVVRPFWLESGEIGRGIMTDPTVTLSVWNALPEDQRPEAVDGGPRISEPLAARLGLAYLSFPRPELNVTGKPHSPVVRLMRRSEFEALGGGSGPTTASDPLVWVVEAQGSWRTGGIVPEEAREDLTVGAVAFDADTGSDYGTSHRYTPLLEKC